MRHAIRLSLPLLLLITPFSISAQCKSGPYTATGNVQINGSCVITGNLTLADGATLNVDLSGASADTFVVQGNILLQGNAILWVHGAPGLSNDQFIVSNSYSTQRTITTRDSSHIHLEYIDFRTQEGVLNNASSIYMNYDAMDRSVLFVNKCSLDPAKAWLLFNVKNKSTLLGYETRHLPTEIYLQDSGQVALHGGNTNVGLWLTLESIDDTLNLPSDQSQPFSWKIGRGAGGLNTRWYLEMDTVQSGIGVQVMPSAKITINGSGFPATGELKVALLFANGTDTLKNLSVGLQNRIVTNGLYGRVTLNNVNLGPIAWQVYALMNENLYIKKSIVNEIGIAGPSTIVVDSSLLQLAVLAAVGAGGSKLVMNNSEIWNQSITAANNSTITLNNCTVTGSTFSTVDVLSKITVNGGCFNKNPAGCTPANMIDIGTGQPFCNPFVPPGPPQILTPNTVTLNGVNTNCITALESSNNKFATLGIYPNPFSDETIVDLGKPLIDGALLVFNSLGELVEKVQTGGEKKIILNRKLLPGGIYFLRCVESNKIIDTYKLIIL